MGKSDHLRLRDIRAAYRLIGECTELGADSYAWRERWFEGVSELIGAVAGIGGEVEGFFHEPQYRVSQLVYTGLDAAGRRLHQRYMAEEGPCSNDQPLQAYMRMAGDNYFFRRVASTRNVTVFFSVRYVRCP